MSQFNIFLFLVTVAVIPTSLVALVFHSGRRRHSVVFYSVMGVAAQLLISLPAGWMQAFHYITKIDDKPFYLRAALPIFASAFNMGGKTVQSLFSLLTGSGTEMSPNIPVGILNFHYWFPFFVVQTLGLAYLFGRRFSVNRKWSDPYIMGGAFLLLANSVINASWPWWSTLAQ